MHYKGSQVKRGVKRVNKQRPASLHEGLMTKTVMMSESNRKKRQRDSRRVDLEGRPLRQRWEHSSTEHNGGGDEQLHDGVWGEIRVRVRREEKRVASLWVCTLLGDHVAWKKKYNIIKK